jgi:glycogen operon protein
LQNPRVLQLVMDSLRYWICEMHVDGFRFDLASTLARELHEVNKLGAFFDIIHQDPVISQVKLIAEPWDLGAGGYQVGNFPILWSEWNGKYRDCVRKFWKGDSGMMSEFATRFCGSSDLYEWSNRRPHASINFITCHDGFTLHDLVSYNDKHNEANGEENRDGASDNNSWNCGVEGPTDDPNIRRLREQTKRNMLATLIFSQGLSMILAGDEIGHTQQGNNNAYCQDNELTWLHWDLNEEQQALLQFVQKCIALANSQPVLQRRRFFHGHAFHGGEALDIAWLDTSGNEMSEEDWQTSFIRCFGVQLFGQAVDIDERGEEINGDTLLLLFNADHEVKIDFALPELEADERWQLLLDTALPEDDSQRLIEQAAYPLQPASMAVLRIVQAEDPTVSAIGARKARPHKKRIAAPPAQPPKQP